MKAISEDLRERAVAAVVSEGWSRAHAGQMYGISAVSVGRYLSATQEALEAAIAAGLATLTAQDACGWFKHCDFPFPLQSF